LEGKKGGNTDFLSAVFTRRKKKITFSLRAGNTESEENGNKGRTRGRPVCILDSHVPKAVIEIQYHCYDSSRYPTVKLSVSGIIKFSSISGFLTYGIRGKCLISSISGFLTVYKVRHGEEPARESTREKMGKKQKHWWKKNP
jgi:hypothetical protein